MSKEEDRSLEARIDRVRQRAHGIADRATKGVMLATLDLLQDELCGRLEPDRATVERVR